VPAKSALLAIIALVAPLHLWHVPLVMRVPLALQSQLNSHVLLELSILALVHKNNQFVKVVQVGCHVLRVPPVLLIVHLVKAVTEPHGLLELAQVVSTHCRELVLLALSVCIVQLPHPMV